MFGGVCLKVVDHAVQQHGQQPAFLLRPVRQRLRHPAPPDGPDALGRLAAQRGQPHPAGAAVAGVGHPFDESGRLQPLQLPGDVGRFDRQPGGQLAGAQRPGVGQQAQHRDGGALDRHAGLGDRAAVPPRPGEQMRHPVQGPFDLGDVQRGGVHPRSLPEYPAAREGSVT